MKKIIFLPLIFLLSLSLIAGVAGAETFTVPSGQEVTRSIGLNNGDRVSGSLSVVGGTGNDINFYVTAPNRNIILRYDRTTQTSFSFTASMTGTYVIHFDNSFSILTSKSVTLDYTVTNPIVSTLQELPLFPILVGIVVVIIIARIVIARRTKRV